MQCIFLFGVTNLAVLALLALVVSLLQTAGPLRFGPGGFGELMAVAAIVGFGGATVSLCLSKWTAKRMMGVRVVGRPRSEPEAWLLATVGQLAAQAGIAMPEVGVFESQDLNAFATGARRDAALIAVSSGLLENMPRAQIRAVLGHEVSHAANGDMVTLALLQGVLNTFVVFVARVIGSLVDRAIFRNDRGDTGAGFLIATMLAQLLLGVGASVIVNWYSRCREFRADHGGATLAGHSSMIGALEMLKVGPTETLPPPMRALGFNTGGSGGMMSLFMSHPTLDARIAALRTSKQ
jgi:heat shock protein HtpX